MAKLVWDEAGSKYFETGVRNGVLYPKNKAQGTYPAGIAWNGLSAITETPSGAEVTDIYADDIKYASYRAVETFGGTIEAYQYPPEFEECDGMAEPANGVVIGQQTRQPFGLAYITQVGNDINQEAGYKIHLIYGASASPSEKSYQSINESPDIGTFSWEFTTVPENVTGHKPVSCITIDSLRANSTALTNLKNILFGSENETARLPLPDEVMSIMGATGATGATGTTGGAG